MISLVPSLNSEVKHHKFLGIVPSMQFSGCDEGNGTMGDIQSEQEFIC